MYELHVVFFLDDINHELYDWTLRPGQHLPRKGETIPDPDRVLVVTRVDWISPSTVYITVEHDK